MSFTNRSARVLLNQGNVVVTQVAGDGFEQLRLAPPAARAGASVSVADQALPRTAEFCGPIFSDALVVCHPNGQSVCVMHAAPLGTGQGFGTVDGASPSRAIVFLYSLESAAQVRPELLCELFALPRPRRAPFASAAWGQRDGDGRATGVSANTFKTQLRMAYEKTHTHRQADLLKLLLSLTVG